MEKLQKIFWSLGIIVVILIAINNSITFYEYINYKKAEPLSELKKSFNQGVELGYLTAISDSYKALDTAGISDGRYLVMSLDTGFLKLLHK